MTTNIVELVLFLEKTLDMNQEMLDTLIEAADFIQKYATDNNIPLPAQQQQRIKSVSKDIKSLSIRMVAHIKAFSGGVDK